MLFFRPIEAMPRTKRNAQWLDEEHVLLDLGHGRSAKMRTLGSYWALREDELAASTCFDEATLEYHSTPSSGDWVEILAQRDVADEPTQAYATTENASGVGVPTREDMLMRVEDLMAKLEGSPGKKLPEGRRASLCAELRGAELDILLQIDMAHAERILRMCHFSLN